MGRAKIGKNLCDAICGTSRRAQHVCLPDAHYRPTCRFERTLIFAITRDIAPHLCHPIGGVVASAVEALRKAAYVPETTDAWARWALLEADRIDPIVSGRALQMITEVLADDDDEND
jgi:hypothetical protein